MAERYRMRDLCDRWPACARRRATSNPCRRKSKEAMELAKARREKIDRLKAEKLEAKRAAKRQQVDDGACVRA